MQTNQPFPNLTLIWPNAAAGTAGQQVTMVFPTLSNILMMPELPGISLSGVIENTPQLAQTTPKNTSTVQAGDLANALTKTQDVYSSYMGYSDDLANRIRSQFRGQVIQPNL
jgi:hypothetical protein